MNIPSDLPILSTLGRGPAGGAPPTTPGPARDGANGTEQAGGPEDTIAISRQGRRLAESQAGGRAANRPGSPRAAAPGEAEATAQNRAEQRADAGPAAAEAEASDRTTTQNRAEQRVDAEPEAAEAETPNVAENDAERTEETPGELTEEEQRQVAKLKLRDAEVRAHEQAHLAAAGSLAKGGARYEYQRGPDGRQYAVGGSVQIDTSPVPNDPEATIAKAARIKRAALAPKEPSGADRQAASKADALKFQAQREILERQFEETEAGQAAAAPAADAGPAPNQVSDSPTVGDVASRGSDRGAQQRNPTANPGENQPDVGGEPAPGVATATQAAASRLDAAANRQIANAYEAAGRGSNLSKPFDANNISLTA